MKIYLKEFGILQKGNIQLNDAYFDNINNDIMKKFPIFKNKLTFKKQKNYISLIYKNVEICKFYVKVDQKNELYLTTEE